MMKGGQRSVVGFPSSGFRLFSHPVAPDAPQVAIVTSLTLIVNPGITRATIFTPAPNPFNPPFDQPPTPHVYALYRPAYETSQNWIEFAYELVRY